MTTLSYDVSGPEDAPVVILGSSLGSDRHMWDEVVPALSDYRVIRYDFPGHGRSEAHKIEGEFTPDRIGDAILEIADAEGADTFHIAGLSLGGMMALWTAINRPQRVASLMMMCSGPVLLPSSAWHERAATTRENGTESLVEKTLQRWFTPEFLSEKGPGVQRTRETFKACDDEGYAQCSEAIANMDNSGGLATLHQPMGIVRSEFDATLPEEDANELAGAVRAGGNSEVSIYYVEGAAHLAAVEKPKAVTEALLAHLKKYA